MRLSRCLISDVGGGWGREIGDYCSFNSVEAILDNSTLASRGYFLLIDTDGWRRSLVNEAWLIKYPRYFENGPLELGYDNRDENTKDSKTSVFFSFTAELCAGMSGHYHESSDCFEFPKTLLVTKDIHSAIPRE